MARGDVDSEVRILAQIAETMGTSMPFNDVLTTAMRFATALMRADGSSILVIERESGSLNFFIALGEKAEQLRNIKLKPGEGIAGFVVETGLPLVVSDVNREPRFSQRVDQETGFKTRSIACVPLRFKGELMGVIEVVSKKPGAFGDKELDMLAVIGGPIAVMLENARLIREIVRLHDELTHASRAKAEVLATMTHEMRTPINIVIGNLDLVLRGYLGEVSERQRKCLETALRNSGEALNLVTSLLDLSRFEAGRYVIHVEEFRLEDIWSELETFFQVGLSGKPVKLFWTIEGKLPALHSDRMKVKEVLSNIVFNAVKYTDRGEVRVTAAPSDGGRQIAVEVKDTGVGIPKDSLEYIFEPFRQAEGSATRSLGGVGLGLAIAKRLIELLNGNVEVESEIGTGTTFRVVLPTRYES
ncbi:MAG TPA: GAF domain-containing sensor histidine kinase [Verrucomicrobiae bacterium]|jgi:signal transduction histidine kinase|nr:GAF domain-containing sensor histidine kinase [Verrucomicrobiae bacterium]